MQSVGIIGLGLIGGSFAKAIRTHTDMRIYATDIDPSAISAALADGDIDGTLDDAYLSEIEYLILALRPHDAIDWAQQNLTKVGSNCLVFDVSGIKELICDTIGSLAKDQGKRFVGAHPMAGYHEGGYQNASAQLFAGASLILCQDEYTQEDALEQLIEFGRRIGFGSVVVTTPQNHDEMIAFTSQLAHIVSSAYIKDPHAQLHGGYSAGSFQDMTRVAILDPDMWSELCNENADALVGHIDTLVTHLDQYREALAAKDQDALRTLLAAGVTAKHASIREHQGCL